MAEFRTLKDFKPDVIVGFNDRVYIEEICYVVGLFTLSRREAKSDDKIFKILNIEDKEEFCKNHYHYRPDLSLQGFPHYRSGDYEAATRVIIALMLLSEKKNKKWWSFLSPKKEKEKS
jgi:hypothetical protein